MDNYEFKDYDKLLHRLSHRCQGYLRSRGILLDYDEIYQEACLTFCLARDNYDPTQEAKFSTYLARAVQLNFWTLTKRMSRDANSLAASMDATIGDEDSGTLHDIVAHESDMVDDLCIMKERKEINFKTLSPLTRTIVELLNEPPAWLMGELKSANEYIKRCRAPRAVPRYRISISFIMSVLGITAAEKAELYSEIKVIINAKGRRA